jgi:uncharacterized protein
MGAIFLLCRFRRSSERGIFIAPRYRSRFEERVTTQKAGAIILLIKVTLLLIAQGVLGAFDTIWYHELKAHLSAHQNAKMELRLHSARSGIYSIVFATLGWLAWEGFLAWLLAALLIAEAVITLWDFLEEDRTRKLPAGERVTHTIMAIVYGAFLSSLLPRFLEWPKAETGFRLTSASFGNRLLVALAAGALLSGLRDLCASFELRFIRHGRGQRCEIHRQRA